MDKRHRQRRRPCDGEGSVSIVRRQGRRHPSAQRSEGPRHPPTPDRERDRGGGTPASLRGSVREWERNGGVNANSMSYVAHQAVTSALLVMPLRPVDRTTSDVSWSPRYHHQAMEYFALDTEQPDADPTDVEAALRRAWNACAGVACTPSAAFPSGSTAGTGREAPGGSPGSTGLARTRPVFPESSPQ